MRLQKGVTIIAAMTLAMTSTGCHKNLDRGTNYTKTHYQVKFDWTEAQDANPAIMQFVAFSSEDGQTHEFGFTRRDGGQLDLASGYWQAVAYNGDTETLVTRGNTWRDFEIAAQETSLAVFSRMFVGSRSVPRGTGSEDEPVAMEPDMLWTGSTSTEFQAGNNQEETITLKMKAAVYTYHFTVNNVHNLQYVTDISATISGMSESVFPSTGLPSQNHCTIPMNVEVGQGSDISASVRTFGHCPTGEVEAQHKLVVYARQMDGSKWYYEFDVTEQMHDTTSQTVTGDGTVEVSIELDELPFPKPFTNGSGMHPDVDNWQDVEVTIRM